MCVLWSSCDAIDSGSGNTPTVISKIKSGAHIFQLHYNSINGVGVGQSFESNVFTIGGYSWKIICYPEGSGEECAGWVSVFLHLERTAVDWQGDVKAKFKFCLLNKNGARDPIL